MPEEKFPAHVLAFFNPELYPHPTREIHLIQTHISWVFLTGEFAYKIKKPVDFGFLDFTSISKRKKACHDELTLNQRLTPEIYLDVLPIRECTQKNRHDGKSYGIQPVSLNKYGKSDGNIIDYCLKMLQFDQNDLFDTRLRKNCFKPEWMDELAQLIAQFHLTAENNPYVEAYGNPDFLYRHIQESLCVAEQYLSNGKMNRTLLSLKHKSRKWFQTCEEKLAQRQHEHHIRNCHGDLHLKNIVLFKGRPTPFDCIEFNDEFRMIDTMNDIAFLVMDCDAQGRSDLGCRFLSRYLEQTGDYQGLELLSLYLSYRAGVRGKVSCLSAKSASLPQDEISELYKSAQHYFTLAEQYLTSSEPHLFMIGGLSGSGKSHLALLGLEYEKAVIIRSDATRKRIAKDYIRLALYGTRMHQLTYQAMFDAAKETIQAGFSVILDATFLHPASRQSAAELAATLNIPFDFYWLDVAEDILKERVKYRTATDSDISDADSKVLDGQLSGYQRPNETYIQFISDSNHWPSR